MSGTAAGPEPAAPRPGHALLLAAAEAGSHTRPAVDAALAAIHDWTEVVELALAHRMTPALLAALDAADPALVPAEILAALRAHCDHLRAQSDAQVAELFALLDVLEQQSVTAVPFKGPLLGELLFGDRALRTSIDIDLLVGIGDLTRVCAVLEARGYVDAGGPLTATQQRMFRRVHCQHAFVRAADGLVVEPHWALTQHPLSVDADYTGMLTRARRTRLAGRMVPALAAEDLLLALCIHGSKHHWERLAWIRDVAALLRRMPDLDLATCAARARSCGCERLLLVGLALSRRCAGASLPEAIERLIAADRQAIALESQVVGWLFDRAKRPPRDDRVDRFRLLVRERWSDRLRYVTRTWLWPGRVHLEVVALPEPLRWGYFPLKVAIDYLASPLWRLVRPSAADRRADNSLPGEGPLGPVKPDL